MFTFSASQGRRDFCRVAFGGLSGLALGLDAQRGLAEDGRPEAGVHGFPELRLQTQRLEELRTFYHKQWGLPLVNDDKDAITLQIGKTLLHFTQSTVKDSMPFYHFAFNVTEHKFDLAREWLAKQTPIVRHNGREVIYWEDWNAHSIYFRDPAGNLGELIAHHRLREKDPAAGEFVVDDLRFASEIGIVVDDVKETAEKCEAELGLAPTAGSGSKIAFVGGYFQFLIVAKKGRKWFMTDDPAAVFPTEVVARGGKTGSLNWSEDYPYQLQVKES